MGYDAGELKGIWEIEAAQTRKVDRQDYERELAGIDIGRNARFHGAEFVEDRRQGRSGASSAQRTAQQQYASRLLAMLANDRVYREAHERAMGSFTNAGDAIDRAIDAGEKAHEKQRRQMDDYLINTARLSDGRHVMIAPDGTFHDQNGEPITVEDAAEVEGQIIQPFPTYEAMMERKGGIERDLAELRGWSVEIGDMNNKANDDEKPASREELGDAAKRADDVAASAEEKQRGFEALAPNTNANRNLDLIERKESTTAMAMPQLP